MRVQVKNWLFGYSLISLIFPVILLSINAQAAAKGEGFLDINAYPYLSDVENDSTVTINVFHKFSSRFSYFSLNNLASESSDTELKHLDTYYSEQNLRWKIAETSPLDLTLQMNFRKGQKNNRHRIGVRWRLHDTDFLSDFMRSINLKYFLNWHAIQFDHDKGQAWQIEHAYRLKFPYLSDRLYISGFIDHTFNEELPSNIPKNPIVAETQFGYRVYDSFYLVAEYRLNQYRRSDVNNFAIGMEYTLKW